jgi:hypothetical protein
MKDKYNPFHLQKTENSIPFFVVVVVVVGW